MVELYNKAVDFSLKIFKEQWIVLVAALSALFAIFLIVLLFSNFGDFSRCSRALKRISKGQREEGLEKLKKQAPVYDKEILPFPDANDFDLEKIITVTFSYSIIKSLKNVVLFTGLFCIIFAAMFSVALEGLLSINSAFNVLATTLLTFILIVLSSIISKRRLKKASKRFYAMRESLKKSDFESVEFFKEEEVSPSILSICEKIEAAYINKESSYDVLNDLYTDLEKENKKGLKGADYEKLKEASEKLNSLIEENNKNA